MVISFYFSLTVWNLDSVRFIGLDNFKTLLHSGPLITGFKNTFIYIIFGSGGVTVISFMIAVFLTSRIRTKNLLRSVVFFPNLVSSVAVGITFIALMHPSKGMINALIKALGGSSISFLGDPKIAIFSTIAVMLWKGFSIATVIYIAGITSIDPGYFEAAAIDGAHGWKKLRYITIPLTKDSINTVLMLSVIGSFRNFDLIWALTGGGPGYATDNVASSIYKQYTLGFYGLSTAGNVILLITTALLIFPLQRLLRGKGDE